jgi:peptidyl-prolyl cis-trans isomerase-like 4
VVTANSGPNLNNSDFFITLTKANINSLAGKHTVFGKVEEGLDVLKKINDTYVDSQYRPQMNIRILHTFLLEDPYPDV